MIEPSHGPTATHRREAGSGQCRSAAHTTSAGPGTTPESATKNSPSGSNPRLSPRPLMARFGTIVGPFPRLCLSRPGITASLFPITPPSRPGSMEDRFPKAETAQAIPQQPPIRQPPGPCDPCRPLSICPDPAIPHQMSVAPLPGPGRSKSATHGMTAQTRRRELA